MTMSGSIVGRFAQAAALLLVVSAVTFALVRLAPGDPAALIYGPNAAPSDLAQVRERWGLEAPLPAQYLQWVTSLLRGDLGRSYTDGRPVIDVVAERVPATVQLTVSAFFTAYLLGTVLGLAAAARAGTPFDRFITLTTAAVYSTPPFWLGIILILVFSVSLGWLPAGGHSSFVFATGPGDSLRHLLLPVLALASRDSARVARMVRTCALDVLGQDFIRTAIAKGLRPRTIAAVHVFRNVMLPVLALQGIAVPGLFSSAVVIETVFSWPGMGRLAIESALQRNYPVVLGEVVIVAGLAFCASVLADVACRAADPRVRLGAKSQ